MKINEFVEYMKKNINKTMKDEQVVAAIKKAVNIKEYMSIKDKKALVDKIVAQCVHMDNGVYKVDGIQRYIYFTMYTLAAYIDIELSDDIEADYDALSESKVLPILVCMIQQEYDDVNILMQMKCDYMLEDNSVEAQIGKFLFNLSEKIDGLAGFLEDMMAGEDIGALLQDKGKIIDFMSKMK